MSPQLAPFLPLIIFSLFHIVCFSCNSLISLLYAITPENHVFVLINMQYPQYARIKDKNFIGMNLKFNGILFIDQNNN
ncbi:hypothetical protein C1646_688927 [Rhizophagus diaphanus]|nr:hypothetical protein C1646_688927 [Rhizophagus diaphanus] [Rhizophagus sp. MUCL 43196]